MVQPYNINIPNMGTEMLSGFQTGQEMVVRRQAQERQAAMQQAMAELAEKKNKTTEDYQRVMTEFPELSKQVSQSLSMFNEQQQQNKINQLMNIYAPLKSGNTDLAKSNLDELITAYRNSGNDFEAKSMETLKQNIELDPKGAETSSELFLFKALGPEAFQKYLLQEQKTEQALKNSQAEKTQSSEILPDGTTIFATSAQKVKVVGPDGDVLTGKDAAFAIKKAKEYGVDIEGLKSKKREEEKLDAQVDTKAKIEEQVTHAKEGTKAAIKKGEEFGKKADLAGERILKIDNAINVAESAVAKGKSLGRGWFEGKFPKMNKYPVLMQQAAYDLGLGVVQSTTFGALSKGELDTAMKTALPEFANDKDTLAWLKKRKAAEEKVQRELNRAAIYLSKPGNTVGKWRQLQLDIKSGRMTPEEAYGETAPAQAQPEAPQPKVFNTMAEAERASMTLPKGTKIQVGNQIFEVE
jgi:glutaredoxin 2